MCVAFDYFSFRVPNGLDEMPYTFLYYNLKDFECISESYQLNFCRPDLSLYLPVRHGDLNKCLDFMEGRATDMNSVEIVSIATEDS